MVRILDHVAPATRSQRRQERAVVLEHGQDHDSEVWVAGQKSFRGPYPAHVRQVQVHDHYVGVQLGGHFQAISPSEASPTTSIPSTSANSIFSPLQ